MKEAVLAFDGFPLRPSGTVTPFVILRCVFGEPDCHVVSFDQRNVHS